MCMCVCVGGGGGGGGVRRLGEELRGGTTVLFNFTARYISDIKMIKLYTQTHKLILCLVYRFSLDEFQTFNYKIFHNWLCNCLSLTR